MTYVISGLDPAPFTPLFGLSDAELTAHGAIRRRVAEGETIPERIELRDAPVGSTVLLVNHTHLPTDNPYRASYAVYVREGATERAIVRGLVPEVLSNRLIALRAFDGDDMLVTADVAPGTALEQLIFDQLARPDVAYLHAHYAKPGCFAALVTRDRPQSTDITGRG